MTIKIELVKSLRNINKMRRIFEEDNKSHKIITTSDEFEQLFKDMAEELGYDISKKEKLDGS